MNDKIKILSVDKVKNGYLIKTDTGIEQEIDQQTYFKYNLYEHDTMETGFFNELVSYDLLLKCTNKANAYLLNGKKTQNRIYEYLLNKGFPEDTIYACIEHLKDKGKIDDDSFIDKFIKSCLKKGTPKDKIISKLTYRGIDADTAIQKVEEFFENGQSTY